LKQIVTILLLVFVFFGCTQKQSVELKLPQKKEKVQEKVKKEKVKEVKIKEAKRSSDTVAVVDELKPATIKESSTEITPVIADTPSLPQQVTSEPESSSQVVEEPIDNSDSIKIDTDKVKTRIAFIYPSSLVEKYAKSSINTISGYLSYQKADYDLVAIDCETESYEKISSAFNKASQKGITKVIGLFTPNAISSLDKIATGNFKIYLPLIEKRESASSNNNLIFGSISYEQQMKKLSTYSDTNNAMFYQDSYIGNKLKRAFDSSVGDANVRKEISKNETTFKGIVNDGKLNNSTLYLNTDIVKTSLILSQLMSYDISPKVILSTQVSYDPILMTLTQERDREKLIVANSIDVINNELRDEISNFGGNILYEWVDYSTLVGINYLYNGGNTNLIKTQIVNNEAVYNPKLYKSTEVGFLEIK